jgi:uncharacterized membrane protein YqgA involved in biofilm formation
MIWLILLVFISDALVTGLAAKEQLALQQLSWSAVLWDGLLALAIAVNIVGFTKAGWLMVIPSVAGSVVGMTLVIYHERRNSGMQRGTPVRVKGFRAGARSHWGD